MLNIVYSTIPSIRIPSISKKNPISSILDSIASSNIPNGRIPDGSILRHSIYSRSISGSSNFRIPNSIFNSNMTPL